MPRRLLDNDDAHVFSTVVVAVIVFMVGTCIVAEVGARIVALFSADMYYRLRPLRTPSNPSWEAWWGYWCLLGISGVVAMILAAVSGRLWYKQQKRYALQYNNSIRHDLVERTPCGRMLYIYCLKSFLILLLCLGIALWMMQWFGAG